MDDKAWLLGNINQTGYFRVNYDLQNWKLLIQQLHNNPQVCLRDFLSFLCLSLCMAGSYSVYLLCLFYSLTFCLSLWMFISQIISVGNRAGLIDDAFNLAR